MFDVKVDVCATSLSFAPTSFARCGVRGRSTCFHGRLCGCEKWPVTELVSDAVASRCSSYARAETVRRFTTHLVDHTSSSSSICCLARLLSRPSEFPQK